MPDSSTTDRSSPESPIGTVVELVECKGCGQVFPAWHSHRCDLDTLRAENERLREALLIAHMYALQGGYDGPDDRDAVCRALGKGAVR